MAIKIGLIGAGNIAHAHISGYLSLPEKARIVAIADVREAAAQECAQEVGGADVFSDYKDMLVHADIDAVDICLPHHLHKDAIVAAANAKKHILCEKPLCLNIEEANVIQKAIGKNGVTLMCAHNQLFDPTVQQAKRLISEGLIGKVYEVRTTDSGYATLNAENIGWRARKELMGGGELIDTGYHPMYLLLYLAASKPVEVTAMLSQHRLRIMDAEDSAQVLVCFENGIIGNIATSWAYEPTPTTDKFTIVGEKGHMYSNSGSLHYKIYDNEPQTLSFKAVDTTAAEISAFASCLLEQKRPIHTQIEGIQVLHIILAAYQAAIEKRTVTFSSSSVTQSMLKQEFE